MNDTDVNGGSPNRIWLRALEATAPIAAEPQRLLADVIEEVAAVRPAAPALISARECLTYVALAQRINRYSRWALDRGLGKGDVACLMMPNRPEYLAIWLGLTRVGVVVALINTQLRGPALAHCINVVGPRGAIVAAECLAEFCAAESLFTRPIKIWAHGETGEHDRLDRAVEIFAGERLKLAERLPVTIGDRALLIYTSGTTGMPKAANVSHRRLLEWSFWFAGLMNAGPDDRIYDCVPLYHSVGGVVATGALLIRGGSVLIREKFSAHEFWDDVVAFDCTLFQYIGELCRYLVNAPGHPRERAHRLRMCCGNGLRADVWEKFQARFTIPQILEFYAATEGNVSLYNVDGKVGAIGRVPGFLAHRFPLALVKFDATAGAPARDSAGFCIPCALNEVGEAIGRISHNGSRFGGAFEGYTSAEESQRKILHDVFERGDAWYRTGDLMRRDASGYFYFIDRIGDTFRWKGENVATSEVAGVITAFPGVAEATVYGVGVPGTEGAAGMAAIVPEGKLDLNALREHLARRLPPYARPLFLRIQKQLDVTTTLKHVKSELKREGFDPSATSEAIYFDDATQQAFMRVDAALYKDIQTGKVRV
jgi:fatty-acyl-CoA synthase